MRQTLAPLIALLVISSAHASEKYPDPNKRDETRDGRFGTSCYTYGSEQGNREICSISIYMVLSNPERYDGRYISVTGYLVDYFGTPTLFPSRESYRAQISADGIAIDGKIPSALEKDMKTGIWGVTVVGEFDAKFQGYQIQAAGRITNLRTVAKIPFLLGR